MTRGSEHRLDGPVPPVPPVPPGTDRPLWSVMIPTYTCVSTLEVTLRSVLGQDPGPADMQIEVVDDASPGAEIEALVRTLGEGRVGFFRHPRNLGHVGNFNACLERARGRLVHLLHGDDYVLPGFYRTMAEAFRRDPEIGAAFCRHDVVDEAGRPIVRSLLERPASGRLDGWLEKLALGQRLQAPSMVVRRATYERLGGFDRRIEAYGEDWEMWTRIAAHYPVWYQTDTLAVYRQHSSSLSGRSARTGQNVRDLRTVIAIIADHLPPETAASTTPTALEICAHTMIRRSHRLLKAGEVRVPLIQLREALRCSRSPGVVVAAGVLGAHLVWTMLRLPRPRTLRRGFERVQEGVGRLNPERREPGSAAGARQRRGYEPVESASADPPRR